MRRYPSQPSWFFARGTAALLGAAGGLAPAKAHPPTQLSPSADKATASEIIEFREKLAQAIRARDAAALRRMYSNGFSHTGNTGQIEDKEARISVVLTGTPVLEAAPSDHLVIRIPEGWTAIATGISLLASGEGGAARYRWTAVYVRTATDWALAASQATRLEEAR